MHVHIDELNLSDVESYKAKYVTSGFVIRFSINGFRYHMHLHQDANGRTYPTNIYHLDEDKTCTYCENPTLFCLNLTEYQEPLFHRLIEFPSIRLEWLFIDHVRSEIQTFLTN